MYCTCSNIELPKRWKGKTSPNSSHFLLTAGSATVCEFVHHIVLPFTLLVKRCSLVKMYGVKSCKLFSASVSTHLCFFRVPLVFRGFIIHDSVLFCKTILNICCGYLCIVSTIKQYTYKDDYFSLLMLLLKKNIEQSDFCP